MINPPCGARVVCWDLPSEPEMVGRSRGMVRAVCRDWNVPGEMVDDLVLVVGELLVNAVVYGRPPIRLSMWSSGEGLCVPVTDHGPEQPQPLDLGLEAVHGRGLAIVETLADRWGVVGTPDGTGKTVWAAWQWPSGEKGRVDLKAVIPRPRRAAEPITPLIGEATEA